MKKIFILLLLVVSVGVNAQWSPKPNNPYKWYHITKDTSIMDIDMAGFDVCIYQGCWQYNKFTIDSLGVVHPPIISATIWFREFASGTMNKLAVSRPFNDYAVDFYDLPFGCENGELGVSQIVNNFLSVKYNVVLSAITE